MFQEMFFSYGIGLLRDGYNINGDGKKNKEPI